MLLKIFDSFGNIINFLHQNHHHPNLSNFTSNSYFINNIIIILHNHFNFHHIAILLIIQVNILLLFRIKHLPKSQPLT